MNINLGILSLGEGRTGRKAEEEEPQGLAALRYACPPAAETTSAGALCPTSAPMQVALLLSPLCHKRHPCL